jgi:peptidoglycan L-alanyl-D-glutamate endopeptidase CwlK
MSGSPVDAHHLPPVFTLSRLSRSRLVGVHPDLVRCVERAIQITEIDFMVVEGVRDLRRQKQLVASGASTTMNSRHLTGHAVDLCAYVDGRLEWGKEHATKVAMAMQEAAGEFGIDLEWGGNWRAFVDTPHYQLSWASYPKQDRSWTSPPQPKPERRETKQGDEAVVQIQRLGVLQVAVDVPGHFHARHDLARRQDRD